MGSHGAPGAARRRRRPTPSGETCTRRRATRATVVAARGTPSDTARLSVQPIEKSPGWKGWPAKGTWGRTGGTAKNRQNPSATPARRRKRFYRGEHGELSNGGAREADRCESLLSAGGWRRVAVPMNTSTGKSSTSANTPRTIWRPVVPRCRSGLPRRRPKPVITPAPAPLTGAAR